MLPSVKASTSFENGEHRFLKPTSTRGAYRYGASCRACPSSRLHRRARRATSQSGVLLPETIAGLVLMTQYPTPRSLSGWAPAITQDDFTGFQCSEIIVRA